MLPRMRLGALPQRKRLAGERPKRRSAGMLLRKKPGREPLPRLPARQQRRKLADGLLKRQRVLQRRRLLDKRQLKSKLCSLLSSKLPRKPQRKKPVVSPSKHRGKRRSKNRSDARRNKRTCWPDRELRRRRDRRRRPSAANKLISQRRPSARSRNLGMNSKREKNKASNGHICGADTTLLQQEGDKALAALAGQAF